MIRCFSNARMTKKKGVRIAYGGETIEKRVKIGKVGLLPSISCTRVEAHASRQDSTYAGPFPCMQSLKNTPVYARTELHTHEYKLHMQARAHTRKNTNRSSSSTFSKKHHPKSILDMFLPPLKVSGFHLNPSHSKTQSFS